MTSGSSLTGWLEERRSACGLSVRAIPWRDSTAWRFEAGRLRHRTGGFFSVIGIGSSAGTTGLDGLTQPIIDQPEHGILGFIVRRCGSRHEWLVQAKAEPGNIGAVQLAPTVQATRSNYLRLHGGAATPYLAFFEGLEDGAGIDANSLQSEQGNRFLGKYNRNATRLVDGRGPDPVSAYWRWSSAAELRAALLRDFTINTDARSVLVASDWRWLADGSPFARWRGVTGWGASLLASFEAGDAHGDADALRWLAERRERLRLALTTIPLESLPGWNVTGDGIARQADGRVLIRAYEVRVNGRETDHWDQPFVLGGNQAEAVLLCQCRAGALRFLLRASAELGFRERVQLGPTWQSDDLTEGNGVAAAVEAAMRRGLERRSTLQSDEGGRFFHSTCRYRIVELPDAEHLEVEADGYRWMGLGQIHRLARTQGVFTNEARSAFSLLLADL